MKCHLLPPPSGHYYDLNEPWNTPIWSDSEAQSRSEVPKKGPKGPKLAFRRKKGGEGGLGKIHDLTPSIAQFSDPWQKLDNL